MANVIRWIKRPKVGFKATPMLKEEIHRFVAVMDSISANPEADIVGYPECPGYFSPMPGNIFMFVVSVEIDQNTDVEQAFDVTVTYANRFSGQDGAKNDKTRFKFIENPLLRPAVVTWGSYKTREVQEFDTEGNAITTIAGEPLILEEEVTRRLIHIQKNIRQIDKIFATEEDFVNKDTVRLGIPPISWKPRTLWLTNLNVAPLQIENGIPYFSLEFDLLHNPKTWDRVLRNVGFHEIDPDKAPIIQNGKSYRPIRRIKLSDGSYPTNPVPLLPAGKFQQLTYLENGAWVTKRFGPGMAIRAVDAKGLLQIVYPDGDGVQGILDRKAFWDALKLTFKTRTEIKFAGTVPLK